MYNKLKINRNITIFHIIKDIGSLFLNKTGKTQCQLSDKETGIIYSIMVSTYYLTYGIKVKIIIFN